MLTLLRMSVDKTFVCPRRITYFEYKGVEFKLRQNNPRKWPDFLATIVDGDYRSPAAKKAYTLAGEWASALAWESGFHVGIRLTSAMSWPAKYTLRNLKGNERPFPRIPFHGYHLGIDINRVAKVTTDEQRDALALFREARNSNNVMLSILLYWQVMDVGAHHVPQWITKTARRHEGTVWRGENPTTRLPVGARQLGDYLQDDFRHAVAHIKRKPGKQAVRLDDIEDEQRLYTAATALEQLAHFYVEKELGVGDYLTLVRARNGGFPRYVSLGDVPSGRYKLAYPAPHHVSPPDRKRSRPY